MPDLRLALRRLVAAPGFWFTAVATLSLGVGATALMFSAVTGLLIRPLPFSDADRLAWILARSSDAAAQADALSSVETDAIAARVTALQHLAVIGDMGLVREVGSRHDRWRGIWATRGLLEVLGASLVAGAVPEQIDTDGAKPILIAFERWQRDFGGDPGLVGRVVPFADNKRFTVAGILPPALEFPFVRPPHRGNGAGFVAGVQDFWVLQPNGARQWPGGFAIARVRAAASLEEAAAQLDTVSSHLTPASGAAGRTFALVPMRDQVLGGLRPALPILQIFAVLVMFVACGNLATLLLARATAQRDEVAVRVALGASSRALARLFVAEAVVLCACGGLAGLALAQAGHTLLLALAPRHETLIARIHIDWSVALFVCGLSLLTTILFGVVPALVRSRAALAEVHSASARQTPRRLRGSFQALVVVQVSLSLTLLVGAVALRDSFRRIMRVDAGYDMRGVVTADVLFYIPTQEARARIDDLVTGLQATPGVTAVGLVHSTPLTGKWTIRDAIEVLDGPRKGDTPPMTGSFVAYDYFAAMGVPLIAGRNFTKAEFSSPRPRIMIINDVAARAFFPGANAVGARVRMNDRIYEIVGVVKGTRDARLDTAAEPQWYQPSVLGSSQVLVRGTGPAGATAEMLRRALLASDPRVIIERIDALEDIASDSVIERKLAAQIVTAFALVAIALAAIGLYGVMHFGVLRRQREFGIRMAIGARRDDVLRLVLNQGLTLAAGGVLAGIAISVASAGALESLLFEARAASPGVVAWSSAALIVVAVVASVHPAWKAASVDPTIALKAE